MTDARDELAELIELLSYLPKHREIDSDDIAEAADAIIAAGWTSPRDERMEKILDAMGAWDDE